MGSNFSSTLSLLAFLLLFTFSFDNCSVNSLPLPSASSDKVSLGVYYESLCPYSMDFIVNNLSKIYETYNLISIVDLHFSPWGNAHILKNNTFDCQHGPKECLLNTIEACAIDAWPDVDKHFQFIYCVETMVSDPEYSWETCFSIMHLDRKPIDECYKSGRGKQLELRYAEETNALKPPHKYVPWVVVDGTPLYDDYENFMTYICKAYKGSSPPEACNNLPVIRKVQVGHTDNFSRRNEDDKSAKVKKLLQSIHVKSENGYSHNTF